MVDAGTINRTETTYSYKVDAIREVKDCLAELGKLLSDEIDGSPAMGGLKSQAEILVGMFNNRLRELEGREKHAKITAALDALETRFKNLRSSP